MQTTTNRTETRKRAARRSIESPAAPLVETPTLDQMLEEPGPRSGATQDPQEATAAPAPEAADRDDGAPEVPMESWVPPVELMTVTASVSQTSEELKEIFDGNDW